jgi:hypothetical protein
LSKTDKVKPIVKRKPHPKRYTDPDLEGRTLEELIEEELEIDVH